MKTLVVYYSLEGNAKYAAERVAYELGADLLRLRPENEPPRNVLKFLVGGKSVLFGEKARLNHFDENPAEYDCIILCSPVWAGRVTPAIREFVLAHPFEGKKTALIASSASGEAEAVFANLRTLLAGNQVVAVSSLRNPLKNRAEADARLDELVRAIRRSETNLSPSQD